MLPALITRLVNLVLLIASVAWLCTTLDWEPFIATVGLVASMVILEIREYNSRKVDAQKLSEKKEEGPSRVDLDLWKKYVAHFPPDGAAITFMKNHDMAAPFHRSSVEPLWGYSDEWYGPKYEFLYPELEMARATFDKKVREFMAMLVTETAPSHSEFFSMGFRDLEDRPEMREKQKKLNGLSSDAAHAYEEFYRVGKRLFKNEEGA